jgi:hypothetical protein
MTGCWIPISAVGFTEEGRDVVMSTTLQTEEITYRSAMKLSYLYTDLLV